jgi:RNA polymerase sigma-70 factor (ECF subfamily)
MTAQAQLTVGAGRPPFEDVYREFWPRIRAYLRAQVRDAAEAEDVAAHVFARAFQAYPRFELRSASPAAWLFKIARNASLDHQRRTRQRERAETLAADRFGEAPDPCRVAERHFLHRELYRAAARLPERQRRALWLHHAHGLGFKEVGERIRCSEDAAKMLHCRALKALRPLLAAQGYGPLQLSSTPAGRGYPGSRATRPGSPVPASSGTTPGWAAAKGMA